MFVCTAILNRLDNIVLLSKLNRITGNIPWYTHSQNKNKQQQKNSKKITVKQNQRKKKKTNKQAKKSNKGK